MSTTPFPQPTRWEERWHPLREEWVVIAAHRQDRPWIGETVSIADQEIPPYQEDCYLCPGNRRISGASNPDYRGVYVFDNDHPCVGLDAPPQPVTPPYPYRSRAARGLARVICYSPYHNLTLAEMPLHTIEEVVSVWQAQTTELHQIAGIKHLLFFENHGAIVGVSNPHPHGQIYATNFVFKTIETELLASQRSYNETGQPLFSTIIVAEQQDGRRILYEDEYCIAFVPYFARYAYEVYVAPKRQVSYVSDLNEQEVIALARALKNVTVRFDNLWQMSFPYVMALHQAPADAGDTTYHFFITFHPPLRQPERLKYLAGPEIGGGNFISDTLPEDKAAELLKQATVHYREQG